jgi:single-stranded DNA-binding protein
MRNQLQLICRITKDPEYKAINGDDFATCSIAYNKSKDKSWFLDITAWKETATKLMDYKKGELVILSGELDVQTWEKDGIKHVKPIMVLRYIQPMSYKNKKEDEKEVF